MANLSLADLTLEVRYVLGSDTDETKERLRLWLKSGYEFITFPNIYPHLELEHSELVTLVAGNVQTTTALWNKVEMVRYYQEASGSVTATSPGWKLWPTSYRLLQSRHLLNEGEPRRYAFRGNSFLLDHSIDTATTGNGLLVAGYRKPADLDWTADDETTDLREEWDQILIYAAAMHGFTSKGQADRALAMREMVGRLINDMPPIQSMSAEDWEWEGVLVGGPGSREAGGMRRGRGR